MEESQGAPCCSEWGGFRGWWQLWRGPAAFPPHPISKGMRGGGKNCSGWVLRPSKGPPLARSDLWPLLQRQSNASQTLCDVIRLSRDQSSQLQEGADPDPLLASLES